MCVGKWSKALRSGKYPQSRSCLFDGYGYCCMGVLEDVVGIEFVYSDDYGYRDEFGADEYPGDEVSREYNLFKPVENSEIEKINEILQEKDIEYKLYYDYANSPRTNTLAALNDDLGADFTVIAEILDTLGWDTTEVN